MGNNWKKFAGNNPNWPVLFVLLIPLCCLGWYLSLSLGNPQYSYNPKISPSGDLIAFECIYLSSSDHWDGLKNDGLFLYPMRDICIKDLENNEIIRVTYERNMYSPTWSSDSLKLAWISTVEDDEIFIWDLLDNKYKKFTLPSNFWYMYPDFDEDHLEWINNDTQLVLQGRGLILNIDEHKFAYLPQDIDGRDVRYYSVSPNGEYKAVVLYIDELKVNFRYVVLGNDLTLLMEDSLRFEIPTWSNNSQYICFVSTRSNEHGVWRGTLIIADVISGESIELNIPSVSNIYYPVWSKNDTQLVFAVYDDELHILDLNISSDPFYIDIQQHKVIEVTPKVGLNPMSISKDGKTIAYSSYAGEKLIIEYIIE